jgi:hypothetical protein
MLNQDEGLKEPELLPNKIADLEEVVVWLKDYILNLIYSFILEIKSY